MVKTIKALHIASFNGNVGDNANHNGFRKRLVKTLGKDIFFRELEMREFYQSWNLRDFNSKEFIEICNDHDLVIIGGGNFFELKWDYSNTGTTVNIENDTLDKIKTPLLFHGVGCDIAKGASHSTIKKFGLFLDRITNDEKILVSVRNDGSYETINKLYGNRYCERIYRVPDGAFFIETEKYEFPELNKNLKSIGINIVSDMKEIRFNKEKEGNISYKEFIVDFAEEVNYFLENNKEYQIILFPHIYSDLIAIYELLEGIVDRFRRTRIAVAPCVTGDGAEKYVFGLYKECDLIMGMRFHSNVCSIAQNVPTIALSSYKKILDLYKEIGLEDRVVEVNKEGYRRALRSKIESTLTELETIKSKYKKLNESIYTESKEFYDAVKIWCKNIG